MMETMTMDVATGRGLRSSLRRQRPTNASAMDVMESNDTVNELRLVERGLRLRDAASGRRRCMEASIPRTVDLASAELADQDTTREMTMHHQDQDQMAETGAVDVAADRARLNAAVDRVRGARAQDEIEMAVVSKVVTDAVANGVLVTLDGRTSRPPTAHGRRP